MTWQINGHALDSTAALTQAQHSRHGLQLSFSLSREDAEVLQRMGREAGRVGVYRAPGQPTRVVDHSPDASNTHAVLPPAASEIGDAYVPGFYALMDLAVIPVGAALRRRRVVLSYELVAASSAAALTLNVVTTHITNDWE